MGAFVDGRVGNLLLDGKDGGLRAVRENDLGAAMVALRSVLKMSVLVDKA